MEGRDGTQGVDGHMLDSIPTSGTPEQVPPTPVGGQHNMLRRGQEDTNGGLPFDMSMEFRPQQPDAAPEPKPEGK